MKTIEEKAEEYALQNFAKIGEVAAKRPWPEFLTKIQEIYKDGAHEAQSNQWINPADRLPELGERFVVCYRCRFKGSWLTLYDIDKRRYYHDIFQDKDKDFIAWMALPKIPDELIAKYRPYE